MKTKVAILGVNGMLGSMVLKVFSSDENFEVIASVRTSSSQKEIQKKYPKVKVIAFDAQTVTPEELQKALKGIKWIINCIGLIKPYIHDDVAQECERAIKINALFPQYLAQAATKNHAQIIQIETDCVYSGKKGNYTESDEYDPLDVYGKTKSLGEAKYPCVIHLRDSIIGPEPKAHVSLMDWFLTQPKNAKVNGFSNHHWNGVTTFHFALLCRGIITNNLKMPEFQHIVAADKPSKAKILLYFAKYFNRQDIKISSIKAPTLINRTLATKNAKLNQKIWKSAGYRQVPTVEQMIKELAAYLESNK